MELFKKALAECIGTMVLVIVGCGVAVATSNFAAAQPNYEVATALAFGLSIVAMAYSIGNISGCHINPAVSLGFALSKKMSWKDFGVYVAAQVVGAFIGALILEAIFAPVVNNCGLGANQVQTLLYISGACTTTSLMEGLLVEVVLTFIFVLAILGVTSKKEYSNVAGIVIGLTLTLVHLTWHSSYWHFGQPGSFDRPGHHRFDEWRYGTGERTLDLHRWPVRWCCSCCALLQLPLGC
jgi:aquaporin Z